MRILILIGALTLAAPAPLAYAGAAIMQPGDVVEAPPAKPAAPKGGHDAKSRKACTHKKAASSAGRPQAKPIKSY